MVLQQLRAFITLCFPFIALSFQFEGLVIAVRRTVLMPAWLSLLQQPFFAIELFRFNMRAKFGRCPAGKHEFLHYAQIDKAKIF